MARSKLIPQSKYIYALVVIGALLVVLATLEITNATHFFHKNNVATSGVISSTNPYNSNTGTNNKTTASADTKESSAGNQNISSSGSTAVSLQAPYGTFVSNHLPGKNGTNTQEESVCSSTPGASCYMKFVQGSIVKTLKNQILDSSGTTYWLWDTKSAGLTSGSWQVFAIVNLNSQTKTSKDAQDLVIQ